MTEGGRWIGRKDAQKAQESDGGRRLMADGRRWTTAHGRRGTHGRDFTGGNGENGGRKADDGRRRRAEVAHGRHGIFCTLEPRRPRRGWPRFANEMKRDEGVAFPANLRAKL